VNECFDCERDVCIELKNINKGKYFCYMEVDWKVIYLKSNHIQII
jgi:hypothetical protein